MSRYCKHGCDPRNCYECSSERTALGPSDVTACSPSSDTPETDFVTGDLSISWYRKAGDLAFLARKLERERNEWKQHAWRESDMREKLQSRIMDLVATDHESKEEFIQRVRGILSENVDVDTSPPEKTL